MDEQLNTADNQTNNVVDDVQMQSQGNENIQNNDTQGIETNQEIDNSQEPSNQPFHKHPDWIKREEKMRAMETRLSEFEQKFNQQSAQNVNEQESSSEIEDIPDDRLLPILSKLPERAFQDKTYSSVGELYQDIRNAIIKDMALLDRNVQKMSQEQLNQVEIQNQQIAAQVQKSFGEDQEAFRDFISWSEGLEKSDNPENRAIAELPYDKQSAIYRQFANRQGKSGSIKNLKTAGRVAGNTAPSNPSGVDDSGNMSIQQAYAQYAKGLK